MAAHNIEVDKNGVILRQIDQATGQDHLINSVMDGGNWNKKNTEKRVGHLLKRPTIQKLFETYKYDYESEKHKYLHFEEKSEQSWYLDSQGNIKEKKKGVGSEGEDDDNEEEEDNEFEEGNDLKGNEEFDEEAEEMDQNTDHREEEKEMISEKDKLL